MFKKILTIALLIFSSFGSSTMLTIAAKNGYIVVVQQLIYAGADINALFQGDRESTPLHLAALHGHADVVDALLQVPGAEVDTPGHSGHTQIQLAAGNGHTAVVLALLNAGVAAHDPDDDTSTALHYAAANGHLGAVEALLAAPVVAQAVSDPGAIVNQMNQDGKTALHNAVEFGHADIVEILLLVNGVDADAQDEDGNSPLHCAAHEGHIAIFLTLLAHGADLRITNDEGHTPLRGATPAFRSAIKSARQTEKILALPLTPILRIPKGLVKMWKTMEHQIPVPIFVMMRGGDQPSLSPLYVGTLATLPVDIWHLILQRSPAEWGLIS